MALGTAVLLGWTFAGRAESAEPGAAGWLGGGMWQQMALLVALLPSAD